MKVKAFQSIDTALKIFYTYPEIGNKQLRELFGENTSSATIERYKKAVREKQAERNILTNGCYTINTEVAYEVFGIDISDLERRRSKLIKLGMLN